jgi:hypothetical protein
MGRSFKIDSCAKCPNLSDQRHYTGDSWEMVFEWKCKAKDNKLIGYEEGSDKPSIPNWCPLPETK